MIKYFKRWEVEVRLGLMGIRVEWREGCQEEDSEMLTKEANTLGFSLLRSHFMITSTTSVNTRVNTILVIATSHLPRSVVNEECC